MSAEAIKQTRSQISEVVDWEPPMPPTDLIFDDGEPLETDRHRIGMNTLIQSLQQAWANRRSYFIGGNRLTCRLAARLRELGGPNAL